MQGRRLYPAPKPSPRPPTPAIPTSTNGLQGQERSRWHHLAEGSEVYPLAWLLALEDPATGKPFLENPERFGLLREDPSPDNPYGLPIGLTADYTRDLRFAGVQMTGINCAACHVNEMHLKGKPVVRIDGAPNLFDVELFFGELAQATISTFKDLNRSWRFTVRLYQVYHPAEGEKQMVRLPRPADDVLRSFKTFGTLLEHGDFEKKLAGQIEALHKKELARPPLDLRVGLVVRPIKPALVDYLKAVKTNGGRKRVTLTKDLGAAATTVRHESIAAVKPPDVSAVLDTTPSKANPLNKLGAAERAGAITDALIHFTETLRLLNARAAFLAQLARSSTLAHTPPGFGAWTPSARPAISSSRRTSNPQRRRSPTRTCGVSTSWSGCTGTPTPPRSWSGTRARPSAWCPVRPQDLRFDADRRAPGRTGKVGPQDRTAPLAEGLRRHRPGQGQTRRRSLRDALCRLPQAARPRR